MRELERERRAHLPEQVRVVGGAPVTGPVDGVDRVALLDEEGRPAGTPVRRAEIVRALAAAAVDQHDGVGLRHLDGLLPLDVHRPAHGRARRV